LLDDGVAIDGALILEFSSIFQSPNLLIADLDWRHIECLLNVTLLVVEGYAKLVRNSTLDLMATVKNILLRGTFDSSPFKHHGHLLAG
jgi:hypothetical protein